MKKGSVTCPRPTRVPKGKERGEMYTREPAKLQRCFRAYMTERPCGASDKCRKIRERREAERDPMHPRGTPAGRGSVTCPRSTRFPGEGTKKRGKGQTKNQKSRKGKVIEPSRTRNNREVLHKGYIQIIKQGPEAQELQSKQGDDIQASGLSRSRVHPGPGQVGQECL